MSDNAGAWFISTDSRTGAGCPAVDAYKKYLVDNGLVIQDDDETPATGTRAPDPSVKPAPPVDSSAQFGNTDVRFARFTP